MSSAAHTRLDALLVERGVADTARRAQALIAAGLIEVDGVVASSASQVVGGGTTLRMVGREHRWASRGGIKLDAALTVFGLEVDGRVCLDAGASTGGFTDVLLSRGAARVYAVDVGHGQLDPRLARDPRVLVMDRTNVRHLESLDGPAPSLITLDLSFISLRAVLPRLARLAPGAEVVALFKPQFEVGREDVADGGVVRDPEVTRAALDELLRWSAAELRASAPQLPQPAQVRGAKGNQEWLVHLRLPGSDG